MKKKINSYISIPTTQQLIKDNPQVLRVVLNEKYTKIDFGYVATIIYDRGGWIKIAPHTFIEVQGKPERYALIDAVNIPISPNKLDFQSTQDWQVFSLYFEPIPMKECVINIIEEEEPDENDFNYMNIRIENLIPVME